MAGSILLIESSTALCSVALARDGAIVGYMESTEPRAHASLTAVYVKELLDSNGLRISDCDAVCVSKGPGSYTGLRVGSSTAKGLCFGAQIPLIAIGTLEVLAFQAISNGLIPDGCSRIVPMIDARRMEVYTAIFDDKGRQLSDTEAMIIESGSFLSQLDEGPVLFIGDAADKCRTAIVHPNAHFVQSCPKASAMLVPAMEAYNAKRFESTAYFEPYYLKQFVAGTSSKKLF